MVNYIIIISISVVISVIVFFSGFGLGTVLVPVFSLFFPIPLAVAATAVVHFANSVFRSALMGKKADWQVVLKFSIPAALFAVLGALLLGLLAGLPPILTYNIGDSVHQIGFLNLIIGTMIISLALLTLLPRFKNISFRKKYLPLGGVVSGFFGGLSGMQGALRSAFLIKSGLKKEAFIGTVAVSSAIIDFFRLIAYGLTFYWLGLDTVFENIYGFIAAAILATITGSIIASIWLKNLKFRIIESMIGAMLVIIGIGLSSGLI